MHPLALELEILAVDGVIEEKLIGPALTAAGGDLHSLGQGLQQGNAPFPEHLDEERPAPAGRTSW